MSKLLRGNKPDVIDANIRMLKDKGLSHEHATHLSMKHANKHSKKKSDSIQKKVTKQSEGVPLKSFNR